MVISKPTKLRNQVGEIIRFFPQFFPDYKNSLYYDTLSDTIMCDMSYFDKSCEDKLHPLSETDLIHFQWIVDVQFTIHNYEVNFSKNTVYDGLVYLAHQSERNPRREWLESLRWDGVPRVRKYFIESIGADMPNLSEEENEKYIGDVTVAWAMGSIARQYGPAQADVIPLLLGDQRIGKSNCIRFLTAIQSHYVDTPSDMNDPKIFLESISGKCIVELSEATALRSKESERTKSFISKQEDTYRKPYDKVPTTSYRKWVTIATSNLRTPFTDITGNMRFFPIYCNDLPSNKIKRYFEDPDFALEDATQFWAEAMYMFKVLGCTPHLSETVKLCASDVQDSATSKNEAVDYLNDYLDNHPVYSKEGAFISREEIRDIMKASSFSGYAVNGKYNITFTWYNTKGCEWSEARPKMEKTLGSAKRPRGYVRKSNANPKFGVEE